MGIVTVGGKQYDPYFILDVTKDDSDEIILKSFRTKVKKYHPDKYTDKDKKAKYESYFKILTESFEYIKSKRNDKNNIQIQRKRKESKTSKSKPIKSKDDLDNFNKEYIEKTSNDPNSFGYGENYKKIENIEEYDNFESNYINQFGKQKFSNEKFNKIFEYNRNLFEKETNKDFENKVIHKTTDGFKSYNSNVIGNCAIVSSYNGLLITGDNFGERGVGYWGDNYSDYKMSYTSVKNPGKKVIVPKDFNVPKDVDSGVSSKKLENYTSIYKEYTYTPRESFENEKRTLYKKTYDDLIEQEASDKDMVLKYIKQYDNETINQALNNNLDKSIQYTHVLEKYIDK
jgi:curved DNA-binding protein CbpA